MMVMESASVSKYA